MPVRKAAVFIIVGFIIRELFSFWTGHPSDFELWVRMGYAMSHGGDPYQALAAVPGLSFTNVFSPGNGATIAYLPFWPILTGLVFTVYSLTGIENRFLYYFLLKQPVIICDVVLAYLLYYYVSQRAPSSTALWALSFWLFSPFVILISAIWGMFDSIAICFLMLSLNAAGKLRRCLWTGLAVFAKSVPIIYTIPMALKKQMSSADVSALIVSVGLPVVLTGMTVLIMHWPLFTLSATVASTVAKGGTSMSIWDGLFYLNYLGILILPPHVYATLGLVWIPFTIAFTVAAVWKFQTDTAYGLVQSLLICTLAFLIFKAQITEQYALYLFSLAIVDVALWHPERRRLLSTSVVVALVYLIVNNYFLVRFLSPVYPGFTVFEQTMYLAVGPLRYAILFLLGSTFTCLNAAYLAGILSCRPTSDAAITLGV